MEVKSNIEELINRLQSKITQSVSIDFSAALTAGVNAAMGQMKYRIFNEGLDKNRVSFGEYSGRRGRITNRKFTSTREDIFDSETNRLLGKKKKRLSKNTATLDPEGIYTEYEKERLSEGRQIRYKDLEFHGSLRRSIVVATISETKVTCIINNETELKIAGYQEEQIGRIRGTGKAEIFGANDRETKTLNSVGNEAIKQLLNDRLFNS